MVSASTGVLGGQNEKNKAMINKKAGNRIGHNPKSATDSPGSPAQLRSLSSFGYSTVVRNEGLQYASGDSPPEK